MNESLDLIATISDVERIEATPVEERYEYRSTYEMFAHAAAEHGDTAALIFLPGGTAEEEPVTFTHKQLFARFTQAANLFRSLGVGKDVVGA